MQLFIFNYSIIWTLSYLFFVLYTHTHTYVCISFIFFFETSATGKKNRPFRSPPTLVVRFRNVSLKLLKTCSHSFPNTPTLHKFNLPKHAVCSWAQTLSASIITHVAPEAVRGSQFDMIIIHMTKFSVGCERHNTLGLIKKLCRTRPIPWTLLHCKSRIENEPLLFTEFCASMYIYVCAEKKKKLKSSRYPVRITGPFILHMWQSPPLFLSFRYTCLTLLCYPHTTFGICVCHHHLWNVFGPPLTWILTHLFTRTLFFLLSLHCTISYLHTYVWTCWAVCLWMKVRFKNIVIFFSLFYLKKIL